MFAFCLAQTQCQILELGHSQTGISTVSFSNNATCIFLNAFIRQSEKQIRWSEHDTHTHRCHRWQHSRRQLNVTKCHRRWLQLKTDISSARINQETNKNSLIVLLLRQECGAFLPSMYCVDNCSTGVVKRELSGNEVLEMLQISNLKE